MTNICHYFPTQNGLRHRDPTSPILFNIIADMLAVLNGREIMRMVRCVGLFLISWIVGFPFFNMQMILLFSWNIIWQRLGIWNWFYVSSNNFLGWKSILTKVKCSCDGCAKEEQDNYRHLFGCKFGSLPFRYLGIPIHHWKLTKKEWKCIEDLKEICPRGNKKVVIYISLYHDKCLLFMLELY